MSGRVNDAQRARLELQLRLVPERVVLRDLQRVCVHPHAFIHLSHAGDLVIGHAGAHQQLTMLSVLQAADAMAGLPFMNKHFGVLCFIPERAGQPAMVFVRMGQDDAANVGDQKTRLPQPGA